MYVLDSDTLSNYFHRKDTYPHLVRKITSTPYEHLWITVISIEEAIAGANKLIYKKERVTSGYELLKKIVLYYPTFQILVYDDKAQGCFKAQPREAKLVKKQDRQIAAIAMSQGLTVVTCNLKDFRQIGVNCVDWTKPF